VVVRDAAKAITFYEHVLGARLVDRTDLPGPDGTMLVAHAVLDFGHGLLQLGDAMPAHHLVLPPEGDDACFSLGYYCPDVDAVVQRALMAGAVLREPTTTFVSGGLVWVTHGVMPTEPAWLLGSTSRAAPGTQGG
jgi:PhnB protein